MTLLAAAHASLGLLLIILAVLAFAGAVWRAFERDAVGAVLLAVIGIIILIVA